MKRILLTATVQSHIAQFHRPLIKLLKENGFEVHVAARDNLGEKNGLAINNVDRIYDIPFQRNPMDLGNMAAYRMLKKLLEKEKYDIISCNTPVAGVCTRMAARDARKQGTRVIYTAHGFHFYKGSPRINWLIYYPLERMLAHCTDTLITVSEEDFELAKKHFKTNVEHIHGVGADTEKYHSVSNEQNRIFRDEQGFNGRYVALCVGELNCNKNQKTVIEAVKKVSERYPEILLLIAGNGPTECVLRKQTEMLGLQDHVRMLGYCVDLEKYMTACDVLVSASFREGMPLNIMEAMICGKPVLASVNRGHKELVSEGGTGFLFKAGDADQLAELLVRLLNDRSLGEALGRQGMQNVIPYTNRSVEEELRGIYGL